MATRRERPKPPRSLRSLFADAIKADLERRYQMPWQKAFELLKLEAQAMRRRRKQRV